jgi:hypothetical protein
MSLEREFSEPRTGAPTSVEKELSEKLNLPEAQARGTIIEYFATKNAAKREALDSLEVEERAILEAADEFVQNAPGLGDEQKRKLKEIEAKRNSYVSDILSGKKDVEVSKDDYQDASDWYERYIDLAEKNSLFLLVVLAGAKKFLAHSTKEALSERRERLKQDNQ